MSVAGEAEERVRAPAALAQVGAGAAARFAGTAVWAVAGVAAASIAVRALGTTSYGVLAFALSAVVLAGSIGRLGLDPAIARTVASLQARGDVAGIARVASGAFTLSALSGLVGGALLFAVLQTGSLPVERSTRLLLAGSLAVALVAGNVSLVVVSLARGLGRIGAMELPIATVAVTRLAAITLIAGLGTAELAWFGSAYALASLAGFAVAVVLARRLLPVAHPLLVSARTAREAVSLAVPYAATGLAAIAISRFDVFVLGLTATAGEVGRYDPTLRVVEQLSLLVPLVFASQYLPAATRLLREGGLEAVRDLYVRVVKLAFVAAFPAVLLLAAFPEALLHALYGGDFPVRAAIAWILLSGFAVNLALGLATSTLAAVGDRRVLLRLGSAGVATMAVLALALIPPFGAVGAATATAGSYGVITVLASVALLRTTGIHALRSDFLIVVWSSALPLAGALALRRWAGVDGLLGAAAWSVSLWFAWIAVLVAARAVRRGDLAGLLGGFRGAR